MVGTHHEHQGLVGCVKSVFLFGREGSKVVLSVSPARALQTVANVTSALKARGLWDNTLLVFSGDNGGPQYWGSNNHPINSFTDSVLWSILQTNSVKVLFGPRST